MLINVHFSLTSGDNCIYFLPAFERQISLVILTLTVMSDCIQDIDRSSIASWRSTSDSTEGKSGNTFYLDKFAFK